MSDNSKGILLTLGSVVFFALMAVLVKAIPNLSSRDHRNITALRNH
jgi:drug/metabolite transporter (DMT)-like permease